MTIARVKRSAEVRGIYFSGEKKWLNSTVGYGYEFYAHGHFYQADTLEGSYRQIMRFSKKGVEAE